ncbi:MAG TPA: hypothetical protein VK892_12260 [Pyrinomonadaceae bacterium]|nr:hypothetical protein [Pyrinomonadaceae bacterium]
MRNHFFKIIVLTIQILLVSSFFVNAQGMPEKKQRIVFPVVPVIFEYEFAPQYFSQWIENHPQYSKIEVIIEEDETLEIALTEKEGGKRVFYSNSEEAVKSLQGEGKEAYLAKIDFKMTQAVDRQANYGFGFLDKHRQPILWRVIPASRPSERGRELIPSAWADGLRLEYRNLATAVGAGTAIQIGEKVIEAEPWKEISSPPYFVAYRGTVAVGRHLGTLHLGTKRWSVTKQPEELKKGAEWIMTDESGSKRTLRIVSDHQNELVIDEVNPPGGKNSLLRLVVYLTPQGYNLRAAEIKSRRQDMRIKFEPELPLQTSDAAKFEGKFIISQGENKSSASGSIFAEQMGGKLLLKWQPDSPSWAKSRMLESIIHFEPNGYSIETRQVGK